MDTNKPIKPIEASDISPFAMTNFRNEQKVFGIRKDDRRRHVYVIGKTGMGKSNLLENLVYTDIQKGNGVCYVDPHGDTAEKMLQWIPEHRLKDTIYFNPSDLDNPIAFNVLEKVAPEFRNLIASGLVSVYKKLWADSWGPRLEYILRYCILALLDSPDSTLLGINRMLVDKRYLAAVVANVTDPVVRAFWQDEFTKWNDRVLAEVISPIQNKVGQFLSNSMIRNIVGQQESSLNLRDIMDTKKILILNLSKGRMGEDASALLGAMMITKLQLAAMSRVDIPEDERNDFYLYVDEFQNFATESFANILSEARKYRLCLTIAHQYIAQLEHGTNTVVRDAVFGNVGTLIVFRVGAADAEFLEKEFAPQFMLEDLVNLPKWRIYLKLMVNGVTTDPFSADALGPLTTRDYGLRDQVIALTRLKYSRTKPAVEEAIRLWHGSIGGVIPPGGAAELFHTGTPVLEAFEAAKAYESGAVKTAPAPSSATSAPVASSAAATAPKPVVWNGVCDVDGVPLALTFMPDVTRPILCQDDLKKFRKGGLTTPQVEAMMMKVMERKASAPKEAAPEQKQSASEMAKTMPAKPNIKIVREFTDAEKEEPRVKNQELRPRRPEQSRDNGTSRPKQPNAQLPKQQPPRQQNAPIQPKPVVSNVQPTQSQPAQQVESKRADDATKPLTLGQKIEF